MSIPNGLVKTQRLTAELFTKPYNIPEGYSSIRVRNTGLSDVQIFFDGDGLGQYITLKSQEILPVLPVQGGKTQMCYTAILSVGELELLTWG